MSDDHASEHHVTDEDLLLDYYGEGPSGQRESVRLHLQACEQCRALDRELRAVLSLVESAPLPEAPIGFERDMWARIEPRISARARPARWTLPQWALAGGLAAMLAAAFALGRVWDGAPVAAPRSSTDARALSQRLIRSEVEDHLERSQRMLVELVNVDDSSESRATDRVRAADLVAAGRLYGRSAEEIGDAETRDLMEDVQRVLLEIANGPADATSNDLSGVRASISDQDLIFRLRVITAEMRERERRARPTW